MAVAIDTLKEYQEACNPYKVSKVSHVSIKHTGRWKNGIESPFKAANIQTEFDFGKMLFKQTIKQGFTTQTHVCCPEFFTQKKFFLGINQNQLSNEKVFESLAFLKMAMLPLMPWLITNGTAELKEISDLQYEVNMNVAPNFKAIFHFSANGRIEKMLGFYLADENDQEVKQVMVEYDKYNIKKGYKIPTRSIYSVIENGEALPFLELDTLVSYEKL